MSAELALFDVAREALAECVKIDEVKDVRDQAERMRLYARQAKDKTLLANASELQLRAERRLGELIGAAKDAGEISRGGRPRDGETSSNLEEVSRPATLKEIGIDHKLSATSQRWAKLGDDEFEHKLEETRGKIISGGAAVVNPLRDLSTGEKKARRAEREAQLGAKQVALPEAKFGVILADPEWQFETRSDNGMDRAADNHYPTSGLAAIMARDVGSLAADDCVLLLWRTAPMSKAAHAVMDAWGFDYRTEFIWLKDRPGTGYWNRNQHEVLMLGVRGNPPAPAMGTQLRSALAYPVGAHSEKPPFAHELAELHFPTLPKIELNARAARPGWARWGYEAPETNSPEIPDSSNSTILPGSGEWSDAFPAVEPGEGDDAARPASASGEAGEQVLAESRVEARSTPAVSPDSLPMTFAAATPILEARYATEDGQALADELGIPIGTLRTWAFRLKLTRKTRIAQMARDRNAARGAADA